MRTRRLCAVLLLLAVLCAPVIALAQVRFSGRAAEIAQRTRYSLTAPTNPQHGDTWVECSASACKHQVHVNGVTRTIGQVTF